MAESEGGSHVRKRKDASKSKDKTDDIKDSGDDGDSKRESAKSTKDKDKARKKAQLMEGGSYWLTRIVFTRAIGFIYCKNLTFYLIICTQSLCEFI